MDNKIADLDANNVDTTNFIPIIPIYIGDYIQNFGVSNSCVKVGDYYYSFDAPANDAGTNLGMVRKFDVVNNCEVIEEPEYEEDLHDGVTGEEVPATTGWPRKVLMGHANGACFDGTYIYIVPLWDLTLNPREAAYYVYYYDVDFNYMGMLECPARDPASISFDWATNTLYYRRYRQVLKWDGTSFQHFTTIHLETTPFAWNQDFAVYNDHFYIGDPTGVICCGELEYANSYISKSYKMFGLDMTARFYMGELEGMEFDPEGHLYCQVKTNIMSGICNTFIMELPVGETVPRSSAVESSHFHEGSISFTEESQRKFALEFSEIRSLLQMDIRVLSGSTSAIVVPEGNHVKEAGVVRINNSFQLMINGRYECENIQLYNGRLDIIAGKPYDPELKEPTMIFDVNENSASFIQVTRSGNINFQGSYPIYIEAPNSTSRAVVNTGANMQISIFRQRPLFADDRGYAQFIGGGSRRRDIPGQCFIVGENIYNTQFLSGGRFQPDVQNMGEYFDRSYWQCRILQLSTFSGLLNVKFKIIQNIPSDAQNDAGDYGIEFVRLVGVYAYGSVANPPYFGNVFTSLEGTGHIEVYIKNNQVFARSYNDANGNLVPSIGTYHINFAIPSAVS